MSVSGFQEQISIWIADAVASGCREFSDIVRTLPGVSPPEIAQHLRNAGELLTSIANLAPTPGLIFGEFVDCAPHPLDYDWRFSAEAVARLTHLIEENCPQGGNVLLLGCPSLARGAASSQCRFHLVDKNPARAAIARGCTTATIDLRREEIPLPVTDVAVIDPPWYPEDQLRFLWTAAASLRVGGIVLASGPPEGSRPSARADQLRLSEEVRGYGLEVVSLHPGALSYLTPPFEAIAFRAAGSPAYPVDWRRGDLTAFRKVNISDAERPAVTELENGWNEVEVAGVRFKVRIDRADSSQPSLFSILPNDILGTVSRRDPLRDSVSVWTSGNRVFGSGDPESVVRSLKELANRPGDAAVSQETRLHAALRRIVDIERSEYIDRGGDRDHAGMGIEAEARCRQGAPQCGRRR